MTTIEAVIEAHDEEEKGSLESRFSLMTLAFVMLIIGTIWRIVDVMVLDLGTTWMNILPSKLGPLIILLVVFWARRESLLGLSKENIKAHLVVGILMGISFFAVVEVLGPVLYAMLLDSEYPLSLFIYNPELLAYAFVFFFINAVYEETLFRGVLQNGFRTKVSPNLAILSSALIFGVWHAVWPIANGASLVEGVGLIVFSGVLGGFFGVYYEKVSSRKSLIAPISAHTLINFFRENFKIGPWDNPPGPDVSFPEPALMPVMILMFFALFGLLFVLAYRFKIENVENTWAKITTRLSSSPSETYRSEMTAKN
ncbi:MAG: lysostaphin resistance A-like protein [Candidatus Thorarchaeota archaeon]